MSEHVARLEWQREGREFKGGDYAREHRVTFGGGRDIEMSAASDYGGRAEVPNPEELLLGALVSCHSLAFLAICSRKGIVVEHYEDAASGTLERPAGGKMQVTRVVLRPKVTFADPQPDAETIAKVHRMAHEGCFIASSVKTEVTVEPQD